MPPPPPPPTRPEDVLARRAAFAAALALLGFAVLTSAALLAWFARAPEPWSWKSAVALVSAMMSATASALVWRAPSRSHVVVGIVVMLMSLLRIGPPSEWTWASFTLLSITVLLLVPVIHAALVLR